jgi:uncharacterized protein with GYD domain
MAQTVIELVMLKYSEKGAAAIVREGLVSRREAVAKVVSDLGGRILGFWATDQGEWDAVFVMETPGEADQAGGVSTNLRGQASGTWERFQRLRLFNPEDVDASLQVADTFRYAGQQ